MTSTTRTYTVTIRQCYGSHEEREVRVRAADENEAMGRGIAKAYGARCSLAQDSGLPRGYGQIVRSLSESERRRRASGTTWAADCITGRVRVTVEA